MIDGFGNQLFRNETASESKDQRFVLHNLRVLFVLQVSVCRYAA